MRSVHHRKFILKYEQTRHEYFGVLKLSPIGVIKHKEPKALVCTNKSPLNSHPVGRKTFVLRLNWECCSPGNLRAIKQTAGKKDVVSRTFYILLVIETSSLKSVESETEQIDLWGKMTTSVGHYVRGFSLFLGVKEVKGEAKSS